MRLSFATQTVTVLRAGTTADRYGNAALDWSDPEEHTVAGCVIQPAAGPESLSLGADTVEHRWTLDAPDGADITALDRVSYNGELFELDGYVQRWESPTGALAHAQALLKRVERT
jgi:head-tail adaptor